MKKSNSTRLKLIKLKAHAYDLRLECEALKGKAGWMWAYEQLQQIERIIADLTEQENDNADRLQ